MKKGERDRLKALFPALRQIRDARLREGVVDVWLRAWKDSNFKSVEGPSQWEPHRDEIRLSNVEHTNQVTLCALAMAGVIEETQEMKVNRDYLIAGALLHDVDKFLLFDARTASPSLLGKQFSHTFFSGHLALAAGLPSEVAHIAAAHSPNFSPMEPQSVEALIVRQADFLMAGSWTLKRKVKIKYQMER